MGRLVLARILGLWGLGNEWLEIGSGVGSRIRIYYLSCGSDLTRFRSLGEVHGCWLIARLGVHHFHGSGSWILLGDLNRATT
ncbi:hypothetical protein BJX76DRAFT_326178 [Aspergillus varians]